MFKNNYFKKFSFNGKIKKKNYFNLINFYLKDKLKKKSGYENKESFIRV